MKVKAALLSLLMLLSLLLGCSSTNATVASTTAPTVEVTYTPVPTEEPTPEPTEEPTPEPTEEPAPVYTSEDYCGVYASGVYMNLPFDIAFIIPDDWGTEYKAALEDGSFYATSSKGDKAMSIELKDVGQTITEAFMDSFTELMAEKWASELEEMNAEVSIMEMGDVEIAGRTVSALYFEADSEDEHINFVNCCLYADSYLMSITVLTTEADPLGITSQFMTIPQEARDILTSDTVSNSDILQGVYVGNQYINGYFSLIVDLPEGWSFYDDDALATQNGVDVSSMVGENWEALIQNSESLIVMGAESADGLQSMNLTLSPVENAETVYTEAMQKLALETSMEPLANVFTGMGYTIDSMEIETAEVMGNTIPCLHVEMSVGGISLSEVLFILSGRDYIFNVAFVCVGGSAYDLVPMLIPLP